MTHRVHIRDRIITALLVAGSEMRYHELMRKVFPPEKYPKAWNYQSNGGPPGCAMAFGKALRNTGCKQWGVRSSRMVGLPNKGQQ